MRHTFSPIILFTLLLVVIPSALHAQQTADTPSYDIAYLQGAPDEKFVVFNGVNDTGLVVGSVQAEGMDSFPATWNAQGGPATQLGTTGGVACGLNQEGVIVGRVGNDAVAWRAGVVKTLTMSPNVTYATAMAIDDHGDIVGQAVRDGVGTAFLRLSDASITYLPALPNLSESIAESINNSGLIVGRCNDEDGAMTACVWRDKKVFALPGLGGTNSEARQVNSHGDIVGDADLHNGKCHACLWRGGKPVNLGTLPGDDSSRALAVNDNDVVVGIDGFNTAFLWKNGQLYKLADLIPALSDWTPSQATAINNKGQIAGWGANDNGRIYGFLLTPR